MSNLRVLDDAPPAPTLERYLAAIDTLATDAEAGRRLDRATVLTVELKAHIAAIGAGGGRLDAVTWASHTAAAFDRILAVLRGTAVTFDELARIGRLPEPCPPTATPLPEPDPDQHALPV